MKRNKIPKGPYVKKKQNKDGPILCYNRHSWFIKRYDDIKDVRRDNDITKYELLNNLRGGSKLLKGFRYEWAEKK